jgi:hypothetical protein
MTRMLKVLAKSHGCLDFTSKKTRLTTTNVLCIAQLE